MRSKRTLFLFLAVAAAAAAACARKTVVIENRYAKGEELRYRLAARGSGTTSMAGLPGQAQKAEMPIKIDMELSYRTVVKSVDAQGTAEIDTFFDRFSSLNESGPLSIRIEADEKGARVVQGDTVSKDSPGLDALRGLFGKPTALTVDKRGRVLSISLPPGVPALLPQMDLGNFLKQGQFLLPEGPVAVGRSWDEKRTVPMGEAAGLKTPRGSLTLDAKYTLARITKRGGRTCAEITVRGEMDLSNVEIGAPQGVAKELRMKTAFDRFRQKMQGTLYFDIRKGCLAESHIDTEQYAEMTIGMERQDSQLKLSTVTKMKSVSDLALIE